MEVNLVEATESNFNGLSELKIENLIVTHDKVLDKHCIICNLGDPRTLFVNKTIFLVSLVAH